MARKPLFKRLPEIWRRLDEAGVLERYLGVMDAGFDRSHDLAKAVLDFRSVDKVPDRFLALLGDIVGHQWRSDRTHDWNRSRIRDAVKRYSYKGTVECIRDLVLEHGGGPWEIVDMASTLLVWNRQGLLSRGDSNTLAADFHHPGAYLLRLSNQVDLTAFLEDFELVKAAGEVWFIERATDATVVSEIVLNCGIELDGWSCGAAAGRYNNDLFLNYQPAGPCDFTFMPIVYLDSSTADFGAYSVTALMMDNQAVTMDSEIITMDARPQCGFSLNFQAAVPTSFEGTMDSVQPAMSPELVFQQPDMQLSEFIFLDSETITMDSETIRMNDYELYS